MGFVDSVTFLLSDYARLTAAAILSMSLASVVFRVLWEFR